MPQASQAERIVADVIRSTHAHMEKVCLGHERELLLELVRTLDHAAFAFVLSQNRDTLRKTDAARHYMLCGAATAMRPLLKRLSGDPGGVPWGPANERLVLFADGYLLRCGELAHVRRLVELERYGLSRTKFVAPQHLVIETTSDEREREDRIAGIQSHADDLDEKEPIDLVSAEILQRIDSYTEVDNGWFIRYDPDFESLACYQQIAEEQRREYAEAQALPPETILGGRTFESWNEASTVALGRVLHHIACATRLRSTNPSLDLRNLLSVFSRKDDIRAEWISP